MEDLKERDHLKRPRRKLEGVDWIQLFRSEAIGVLVITVVNSQVLYEVGIFLTYWINSSFWRKANLVLSVVFTRLVSFWCSVTIHTLTDNKICELATVCVPWQHWTKPLVWFINVDIAAFHSCVVYLWQSLSEWHLLLSACVLVCRRENVGAWIRATNEH